MEPTRKNIAVFVDRDGTVVDDPGYTHRVEELRFLPNAVEGLKLLSESDFRILLLTNQSGIARGYYTEEDYRKFTDHLLGELLKQGVRIDRVYHCPHHPDDGCSCRKPEIGMLRQAERDFGLDLSASFMVGDKESDLEAGRRAGCRCVHVVNPKYDVSSSDFRAKDLLEAAEWLRRQSVP